jgi:choline-glycine betaine transporter
MLCLLFIAWGAFVGLFIGRISRGRTIRQVVIYAFIAPLLFNFLWFATFGGAGIRQQRQALELEKLGTDYFNNSAYYLAPNSTVL